MTTDEEIRSIVDLVETMLSERKYLEIDSITDGVRMSAEDIKSAIRQIGADIIKTPAGESNGVDIIRIENEATPTYSVVSTLWTKKDGKSDLSLEMTIKLDKRCTIIELDNIHVR